MFSIACECDAFCQLNVALHSSHNHPRYLKDFHYISLSCPFLVHSSCFSNSDTCHLYMYSYFLTVLSSVVAMTKKNANAALVYSFLYKIVQVSLFLTNSVQVCNFYFLLEMCYPTILLEMLKLVFLVIIWCCTIWNETGICFLNTARRWHEFTHTVQPSNVRIISTII